MTMVRNSARGIERQVPRKEARQDVPTDRVNRHNGAFCKLSVTGEFLKTLQTADKCLYFPLAITGVRETGMFTAVATAKVTRCGIAARRSAKTLLKRLVAGRSGVRSMGSVKPTSDSAIDSINSWLSSTNKLTTFTVLR